MRGATGSFLEVEHRMLMAKQLASKQKQCKEEELRKLAPEAACASVTLKQWGSDWDWDFGSSGYSFT